MKPRPLPDGIGGGDREVLLHEGFATLVRGRGRSPASGGASTWCSMSGQRAGHRVADAHDQSIRQFVAELDADVHEANHVDHHVEMHVAVEHKDDRPHDVRSLLVAERQGDRDQIVIVSHCRMDDATAEQVDGVLDTDSAGPVAPLTESSHR